MSLINLNMGRNFQQTNAFKNNSKSAKQNEVQQKEVKTEAPKILKSAEDSETSRTRVLIRSLKHLFFQFSSDLPTLSSYLDDLIERYPNEGLEYTQENGTIIAAYAGRTFSSALVPPTDVPPYKTEEYTTETIMVESESNETYGNYVVIASNDDEVISSALNTICQSVRDSLDNYL